MGKLTNLTNISLPLAVWLANDDYDFYPEGHSISATALLKPMRQILLRERMEPIQFQTPDITDFVASRMGHAIHDGIEKTWLDDRKRASALKNLGIPQSIIDRIVLNPTDAQLRNSNEIIPVYTEHRGTRKFKHYTISGKFDLVFDGELHDYKSTSVYSYLLGDKDEDYRNQGSLYRWIHRDKIFSNYINIQFVFTDWQAAMARQNPDYPSSRLKEHKVKLMSLDETEAWIDQKITALEKHADLPEAEIPFCTDKELWRSSPVWKYFSNPEKAEDPNARSQKNFDNAAAANAHLADKMKGAVIKVPGTVKACPYCPAFPVCSQRKLYFPD